jgi:hypothetical protein
MGLFNFCPNDPAVFTGLHQWTGWAFSGRTNWRRCINCGYVQKR